MLLPFPGQTTTTGSIPIFVKFLIENARSPSGSRADSYTVPKMRASDYFDVFKQAGVVLFSKEVANSAWGEGMCVEWSNLKLHADFFGNSIARTINYTERY
jgi:hypothetical protein